MPSTYFGKVPIGLNRSRQVQLINVDFLDDPLYAPYARGCVVPGRIVPSADLGK